jgi:DhnA family fructose-bisphosphate aldolase class Ia
VLPCAGHSCERSRSGDPKGLLKVVRDAMDAGAKGMVMGRNVWGHKDVSAIMCAIHAIVHQDATLKEALKLLI